MKNINIHCRRHYLRILPSQSIFFFGERREKKNNKWSEMIIIVTFFGQKMMRTKNLNSNPKCWKETPKREIDEKWMKNTTHTRNTLKLKLNTHLITFFSSSLYSLQCSFVVMSISWFQSFRYRFGQCMKRFFFLCVPNKHYYKLAIFFLFRLIQSIQDEHPFIDRIGMVVVVVAKMKWIFSN